ncbi:hypothetical protein PENSPDRAFT_165423 [Peniophora sp. CONT]|nr:hypothetical protein PENSPDRAFT_165423 [Peniophora sp. CONT]
MDARSLLPHSTQPNCLTPCMAVPPRISRSAKVKARVVALAPNLPAEVLCMVFDLLVPKHCNDSSDRVRVTHVCQQWRSIAIGHRTLWTTLYAANITAWDTFVRRAKGAPLEIIDHGWSGEKKSSGVDRGLAILPLLPSTKSITLNHGSPYITPDFLAQVASSDSLTTFTLRTDGRRYEGEFPLPSFGSKLHSLAVSGVYCPWNSIRAPGIRKLEIQLPAGDLYHLSGEEIDDPRHFMDLLDALRSLSLLEVLDLCRVLPLPTSRINETTARVELPYLQHLSLKGIVSGCSHLWSLLDLSIRTSVLVQVQESWALEDIDIVLFGQALETHLLRIPDADLANPTLVEVNQCWNKHRRASVTSDYKKVRFYMDGPGDGVFLHPQVKGSGIYLEFPGFLIPDGTPRDEWNSFPVTAKKRRCVDQSRRCLSARQDTGERGTGRE